MVERIKRMREYRRSVGGEGENIKKCRRRRENRRSVRRGGGENIEEG